VEAELMEGLLLAAADVPALVPVPARMHQSHLPIVMFRRQVYYGLHYWMMIHRIDWHHYCSCWKIGAGIQSGSTHQSRMIWNCCSYENIFVDVTMTAACLGC